MAAHVDELFMCRQLCANRLRRLERYKKAKSFCSLEEENAGESLLLACASSPLSPAAPTTSANAPDFDSLREKMMSLMEDDISVLQKLLALSDKIHEMKVGIRRSRSERRLSAASSSAEEDDDAEATERSEEPSGGVTRLYVDADAPQYFSRQNSVLRIPIPPRASNRFNRRPARKGHEALRVVVGSSVREEESEPEDPVSLTSPALTYSASSASSCGSGCAITKKTRSSHSSIDSGLPPTPTESD